MKYSKGYPKDPGLYSCFVDGQETVLRHSICQLTGKHRWINLDGSDVLGEITFGPKVRSLDEITPPVKGKGRA